MNIGATNSIQMALKGKNLKNTRGNCFKYDIFVLRLVAVIVKYLIFLKPAKK